ncbi:HAMP domain-containing protein [Methylolobus aquaticus]|nr:HAMP domain-containing protein [Methylolobus aquaticus]
MRSIRFVFPLILTFQMVVAVGLTGTIAYLSHLKEARETAAEIVNVIGSTMDEQLYQYLYIPMTLTEAYAERVRLQPQRRFSDIQDPETRRRVIDSLWTQSRLVPWANLTLTSPTGQMLRIDRTETGTPVLKLSDARKGGMLQRYLIDSAGRSGTRLDHGRTVFDPLQQDYYRDAVTRHQRILSPIYFSAVSSGAPVVTIADPVFDDSGHVRLVVSSDIHLDAINGHLQGLTLPPDSLTFIFDTSGRIVASSNFDLERGGKDRKAGRLDDLAASDNPVARASAKALKERFPELTVSRANLFQFVAKGRRNYVYAAPLFADFGLNWQLAVVISESGLIENLIRGVRTAAWVSLGLLLISILVGLRTAGWMVRPILTLRDVVKAVEKDQLDLQGKLLQKLRDDAHRRNEFGELATAALGMVQEVEARHDLLESQLEQLRVAVDASQTRAEIEQVTGTPFFRSLQEQARALREQNRQRRDEPGRTDGARPTDEAGK